jgi:hypothetical protein
MLQFAVGFVITPRHKKTTGDSTVRALVGLTTTLYSRSTYDIFGRENKGTVIYGAKTRFWQTVSMSLAARRLR